MSTSDALRRVYENLRGRLIVPHQVDGVRWMLEREFDQGTKGGIVADEMGLGKTVCVLAAMLGNQVANPTLIVAPKSLLDQWVRECIRFTGIHPRIIRYRDLKVLTPVDLSDARVILTTYECLRHTSSASVLKTMRFGRVVLDEAHSIKNKHAKRSQAAYALRADIRWCITGTPVTRKKRDFRTLMNFVGVDSSDYNFMRETYALRRTFEDASKVCDRLRLPPLYLNVHPVPFETEEEKNFYRALAEEASLRIRALESGVVSEDNTYADVIEVILRLRQAVVNPQLVCSGRGEPDWTGACTKRNELVNLISSQPRGSKTLVFTHWNREATDIVETLRRDLQLNAIRIYGGMNQQARDDAVKAFTTDPSVDALVLHIDVGGVGLNLQAATHVYINSLDWSPASELQAIARAHRLGVEHPVTATRLVVKGTIDEYILNMHDAKLGFAADVLNDQRIVGKLDSIGMQSLKSIRQYLEYDLD
jgi:SNF2 family DNA or RNA helicase